MNSWEIQMKSAEEGMVTLSLIQITMVGVPAVPLVMQQLIQFRLRLQNAKFTSSEMMCFQVMLDALKTLRISLAKPYLLPINIIV